MFLKTVTMLSPVVTSLDRAGGIRVNQVFSDRKAYYAIMHVSITAHFLHVMSSYLIIFGMHKIIFKLTEIIQIL